MLRRIKEIAKEFPEIVALPIALILFWFAPNLIRSIDPAAVELSIDVVQFNIYAGVSVLVANFMAFMGVRFNFKNLYKSYHLGFAEASDFWRFFAVWATLFLGCLIALLAVAP
jgi:hypothetical protein